MHTNGVLELEVALVVVVCAIVLVAIETVTVVLRVADVALVDSDSETTDDVPSLPVATAGTSRPVRSPQPRTPSTAARAHDALRMR